MRRSHRAEIAAKRLARYSSPEYVDHVVSQICKHMAELIQAKKKREVKPAIIREHLSVFIRAVIECPWFDSEEPIYLSVSSAAGGVEAAMNAILIALGKREPADIPPTAQPSCGSESLVNT